MKVEFLAVVGWSRIRICVSVAESLGDLLLSVGTSIESGNIIIAEIGAVR